MLKNCYVRIRTYTFVLEVHEIAEKTAKILQGYIDFLPNPVDIVSGQNLYRNYRVSIQFMCKIKLYTLKRME